MTEHRGKLTGGLEFINTFDARIEVATSEQARAATLRKRAKTLEERYPGKIDSAIDIATKQLFEQHQATEITDEEAILGVLRINQQLPPKVIRTRKPSIEQGMADFQAIQPGAPVIKRQGDFADTLVVADEHIEVSLAIARGMGGLPQANILVPAHKVFNANSDQVVTSAQVTPLELRVPRIDASVTIGHVAIQQLLDQQRLNIRRYTSGYSEHTNAPSVRSLATAASRLTVIGHDFDTARIDELLEEISTHEAEREAFLSGRSAAIRKIHRHQRFAR